MSGTTVADNGRQMNESDLDGPRRRIRLPADLALSTDALAALGAEAGDTVEVRAVRTAPR